MIDFFSSLSKDEVDLIFKIISSAVIIIGVYVGIKNLRIIASNQKFEVLEKFIDELKESEEERKFIYQEFNYTSLEDLSDKEQDSINKIINTLNRTSVLIDNKFIDQRTVMALCHTMIIRCVYQLKDYIADKENSIGGRYARRIIRLDNIAKNFHDSYKYHRKTEIRIYRNEGNSELIYKTELGADFEQRINNRLQWTWYRLFKNYKPMK